MKEPTQEQIKEFWEWCGLRHNIPFPKLADTYGGKFLKEQWYIHSGFANVSEPYCGSIPSIDLNNLFKYATDRVREKIGEKEYFKLLVRWCMKVAMGEDPALALFWVLHPVLKEVSNG